MKFAAMCIVPIAAIAGLTLGGGWTWLGFGTYVALYMFVDNFAPADVAPPSGEAGAGRDALLFLQVPLVCLTWIAFLRPYTSSSPLFPAPVADAPTGDLAGAALSLFVTVAVAGTVTAHELIHRTGSKMSMLAGRLLLAFIFDAAFAVEHVYGHHVRVATWDDPATARRGETVYAFIWRSSSRSFLSAWAIERQRLSRRGDRVWSWHNRNLRGIALSLGLVIATYLAAGGQITAVFAVACVAAKVVLEMTNYVEHYGLVRVPGTPVAARHSWDTKKRISAAGMFNLGRHAAHHMKATLPYWQLSTVAGAPSMPAGVAASTLLAAVPPLWFRIMARKLARWDRQQATDAERDLIHAGHATSSSA